MNEAVSTFLGPFELLVVVYSLLYLACNATLIILAFRPLLNEVKGSGFADLGEMDEVTSTIPSIAIIVPAYNEEMTIVESVRSFMEIDYPQIEIVAVSDGSTDRTMELLRAAYGLQRRDVPGRAELETATVRAVYEATEVLPDRLIRFLVVDKENGGRADALNAGMNFCVSPYVLLVDADCLVDPLALKQVVRHLQIDPDIVAIGGQVGVINECHVDKGRISRARVPRAYWPLCQTLEYLRAFSLMRTGFSRLNGLMILSGAFMVTTRSVVMDVGGFLTGRSHSKLLDEYVGPGKHTICEDMEIIVRIHRYLRQRGLPGRVVHTPMPLVWTEVPPNPTSLGLQRRRWHRGFLEILSYHRRMILNPDYGRVGLLSLPYLVWFELLGPYIESIGLFVLPLLALAGLLDPIPVILITAIALGCGVLQSLLAVLGANWMASVSPDGTRMKSLTGADRWRDRLLLLSACFLGELGYRQMTLIWRLRGTWDYFRGHTGWDKFARAGFQRTTVSVTALLAFLCVDTQALASTPAEATSAGTRPDRTALVIFGSEHRAQHQASWWLEFTNKWSDPSKRNFWLGLYHHERDVRKDDGIILGFGSKPRGWVGYGTEVRITPGATFAPSWSWSAESEVVLARRFTGSGQVRVSSYTELLSATYGLGIVYYGPFYSWLAVRVLLIDSHFREVGRDRVIGGMARGSVRLGSVEGRLNFQYGGESYLAGSLQELHDIRAVSAGAECRMPLGPSWIVITGLNQRWPERGPGNLYLHTGLQRLW